MRQRILRSYLSFKPIAMKNLFINILFTLLDHSHYKLYNISSLFGAQNTNHQTRKRKWEKALVRLYNDKDLLDYLYYQSESDKEKAWRGKVDKKTAQGARLRTLHIVYSARRAYENTRSSKQNPGQHRQELQSKLSELGKTYQEVVDIE